MFIRRGLKAKMNSKLIVGIVPTFHLKKIDSLDIYQRLIKGEFKSVNHTKKTPTNVANTQEISLHGNNSDDSTFTFKDHNNLVQVIVTSNHYDRHRCDWCLQPMKESDISIGVPITYDYQGGNHIFEMEGCCHSFECAFSYMKRFRGYHVSTFDPVYMNSETILRFLFHLCYPDEVLRDSPDPRITLAMGGAVGSIKHTYVRIPSVIIQKAKVLYQRS
jgi:hypothetical protein